jgi:hypothetical protein
MTGEEILEIVMRAIVEHDANCADCSWRYDHLTVENVADQIIIARCVAGTPGVSALLQRRVIDIQLVRSLVMYHIARSYM